MSGDPKLRPIRDAFEAAQREAEQAEAEQKASAAAEAAAERAAEQERQQLAADRAAIRGAFKRGGGAENGLNMALRLGRALRWSDDDIRAALAPKRATPRDGDGAPRPSDGAPDGSPDGSPGGKPGDGPAPDGDGDGGRRFIKRKTPIRPLPGDCPVIPLGKSDGLLHFLDPLGQLRSIKAKDLNAAGLRDLFCHRGAWLWANFPKYREQDGMQSGWKADECSESLIDAASRKGVFDPIARVRGVGGWRCRDGGLILHCGDAVLINGEWLPPGEHDGYIYPGDAAIPRPSPEPAPREVAGRLLARLDTWNWRGEHGEDGQRLAWDGSGHKLASLLALGWFGAALAGAALDFRPVTWLTAEAGDGKTTLLKLYELVLGGGLVSASNASESGVSTSLGYSTKAVLLDEAEDEGDNRRVRQLIELARQAASGGSKLRGSSDHQAHAFNAKSSFIFASIIVPSLPPADASRILVLKMAALQAGSAKIRLDADEWAAVGAGLRRRLVDGWARWDATFDRYREELARHGYNARGLDQMGTLLAMSDLMRFDGEPDGDTVSCLCAAVAAQRAAEDYNPNNAESMLNHLLSIPLDVFRGGERMTIGVLVARACELSDEDKGGTTYKSCQQALTAWSIYVDGLGEAATVTLPYQGEGLRKLFEGTHWRGVPGVKGGWAQAMERLPGAKAVNSRRFGGRGWSVPARTFLLLRDGETLKAPPPPFSFGGAGGGATASASDSLTQGSLGGVGSNGGEAI